MVFENETPKTFFSNLQLAKMYFLSLILYFYLSASIIASPFPEQSDFIDNSEGNPDLIASSDIDSNDLVATTQNRQDSNYVNPGDFPSSGTPITNYQSQLNTILVAERKKGRKGRWVIPNPRTAKTRRLICTVWLTTWTTSKKLND